MFLKTKPNHQNKPDYYHHFTEAILLSLCNFLFQQREQISLQVNIRNKQSVLFMISMLPSCLYNFVEHKLKDQRIHFLFYLTETGQRPRTVRVLKILR